MTIHSEHPFVDGERQAERQLRARLGARVCLLTTGEGRGRTGWTVSQLLLADGPRWRVVALVDPDSDLADALMDDGEQARAVLHLLGGGHRYLADAFAGLAPAPGGPFTLGEWEQTAWGPRLLQAGNWAALVLESHRELGWGLELVFTLAEAHADDDPEPLHHRRGRYLVLD